MLQISAAESQVSETADHREKVDGQGAQSRSSHPAGLQAADGARRTDIVSSTDRPRGAGAVERFTEEHRFRTQEPHQRRDTANVCTQLYL